MINMPSETKGTPQPITLGSEDNEKNKKDFRQSCKYGKDCYQKNPMHHQKFRHPKYDDCDKDVKKPMEDHDDESQKNEEPAPKKIKLDEEEQNLEIKESDEESDKHDEPDGMKGSKPQVFDDDEKVVIDDSINQ